MAEIFDEPLLGLVVDKDIVMADAGLSEAIIQGRIDVLNHFLVL